MDALKVKPSVGVKGFYPCLGVKPQTPSGNEFWLLLRAGWVLFLVGIETEMQVQATKRLGNHRPRLAVTLGDPAGIGPEVVLKALADPEVALACEVVLVGRRSLLVRTYQHLRSIDPSLALADPDLLSIEEVDVQPDLEAQIRWGQSSAASGELSFRFLEAAIAQARAGQVDGIVTGPIAKSAWHQAGHRYPGQTELLAERAEIDRFGMLFVARSPYTHWTLRTLLATTHIPLRQVPEQLTPALLTRKLDLLVECLRQDFGLEAPRIAVAGLNPHSGEQGQLGHEEQDWLIPWLSAMRDRWPQIQLEGPIPPDTLWVKPANAWFGRAGAAEVGNLLPISLAADAYLALYHDQGLIPVKLMAFDRAVNTSIGLPFVRTSPDHGTAFDIAGAGIADARSMKAALQLATELCQSRSALSPGSAGAKIHGL